MQSQGSPLNKRVLGMNKQIWLKKQKKKLLDMKIYACQNKKKIGSSTSRINS